jgi:hypothetical protein
MFSNVVFPDPDRPRNATSSPRPTPNETPRNARTAVCPLPNVRHTPSATTITPTGGPPPPTTPSANPANPADPNRTRDQATLPITAPLAIPAPPLAETDGARPIVTTYIATMQE